MAILKNRFYRLGIIFLALTLLTVGLVGNTLAKYVTAYTSDDSARVAQWGVKVNNQLSYELVENEFDLFNTVYDGGTDKSVVSNYNLGTISDGADGNDFVFAPGTTGSMEITVSGQPEVAYEFHFDLGLGYIGSWIDSTGAGYNPILFKLYSVDGETTTYFAGSADAGITLDALNTAMSNLEQGDGKTIAGHAADTSTYAANTKICDILGISDTAKVYVSWEWPFESSMNEATIEDLTDVVKSIGTPDNDAKDTFLGDIASVCSATGSGTINGGDVTMPNIKLNAKLGATQLDAYVPAA